MSYATAALATFDNILGTLDHLVTKAESHEKGAALLQARLASDMYPLHTQIRMTIFEVDTALAGMGRFEWVGDSEIASFADAHARIAAVRERVAGTDAGTWPGATEIVEYEVTHFGFPMHAHEYYRDWLIPQVYFHLMTTYCILRAEGVPLAKIDYIGYIAQYATKMPAG